MFFTPCHLVHALTLAPLARVVGIVNSHAHHRDGGVHATDGTYAGDSPAGADDHATVDLLPQGGVGAPHVTRLLGRHGGGLQAVAGAHQHLCGVMHHAVSARPARRERKVVPLSGQRDADDVRSHYAERLLQQFLTGLVTLHHYKCR